MKVLALASLLLALTAGNKANAEIAAPLWTCKISAQGQDSSVSVLLGVVKIQAKGTMKCLTMLGQRAEKPVVVDIRGVSVGPDISFPDGSAASLKMRSLTIGLSTLNAIYGRYTVSVGAGVRLGATKLSAQRNVLSFTPAIPDGHLSTGVTIALEQGGQNGFGANAFVTGMRILTPAEARRLNEERFREEQRVLEGNDNE